MATSTDAVSVTIDQYLNTSYRPDCDWIDGELKERNVGEAPHSAVQKFIITYLSAREEEWGITIWPEQRVQTSTTHYRVPDICVTRDTARFEPIITSAPLVCIEIMSREDRLSELKARADDYLAMGVLAVWIIDSKNRTAWTADRLVLKTVATDLTVQGFQIRVPVAAIFAYLDKLQARR